MDFEWDPKKAPKNLLKHEVSFEEAATVFADDFSVAVPDPDHSDDEQRMIVVGSSSRNQLLIVAHLIKVESIRIISARKLTRSERIAYEEIQK